MTMSKSSIFALDEFKPYAGEWSQRQRLLAYRKAYYDGTIYRNIRQRFEALGQLQAVLGPRLYRGTKAMFLKLSRAVDVDAGIIPGGWSFKAEAPASWATATKQIMSWSDWSIDGVLFIHYGAQYGLAGLKVSDLREAKRVIIKPIDPATYMLVRSGHYDARPRQAIVRELQRDGAGKLVEFAEVVEADRVRTFINGEPAGIDDRPAEYDNMLGFVPFAEAHHLRTGEPFGECTYQKAIPVLDEVNELASYLADIIKKHAEAQWVITGGDASDLEKSGDNIWFMPAGSDAKALVAAIDIPGVLAFIQEIEKQVSDALPELAFDELKRKDQIATATLELQLAELVFKVKRTRPNYDHALADALRMAGRAAAQLGLADLATLDDEALAFDEDRPVLPLDRETQIRIAQAELALQQQEAITNGAEGAQAGQPQREPADQADDQVETDQPVEVAE